MTLHPDTSQQGCARGTDAVPLCTERTTQGLPAGRAVCRAPMVLCALASSAFKSCAAERELLCRHATLPRSWAGCPHERRPLKCRPAVPRQVQRGQLLLHASHVGEHFRHGLHLGAGCRQARWWWKGSARAVHEGSGFLQQSLRGANRAGGPSQRGDPGAAPLG